MASQYTFDDEYYVIKAQGGDHEALEQLFKKYHHLAYYIALKLCHCDADAEDIVQESFIEIERSIAKLQEPKYFKAWLNKVIFSKSTKLFRKNRDVNLSEDESLMMRHQKEERRYLLPEEKMKHQSDREVLLHFVRCLPDKLSSCLYLMYFEQMSVKEIAFALDIPEGTVKSRVSNAKAELKSMITSYEQREQVKLNFRCTSLEGALALVLMKEYETVCASMLAPVHFGGFRELMKKIPTSAALYGGMALLSATMLVGTGVLMDRIFHPGMDAMSSREIHTFEPVEFRGRTITTARAAYTALVNTAHCAYEIEHLDAHTRQEMKNVYRSLKKTGGVYYGLLDQRNYAEMLE